MTRQKEKTWVAFLRIALACVFLFSGFTKAVDPVSFGVTMHQYFISFGMGFMQPFSLVLGMCAIVAEFVLGFMLLFRLKVQWATLGYFLFMTFFFFLTMWLAVAEHLEVNYPEKYNFGVVRDCGCFGEAIEMSNLQTFLKNVVIYAVTIIVFLKRKTIADARATEFGQWLFASLCGIAIVIFQIYSIRNLPVIDFSEWKIGTDVAAKFTETPDIKDFKFVYQSNTSDTTFHLSTTELETITDSLPLFYEQYSYVDRVETIVAKGDTALIKGFSMLDTAGSDLAPILLNEEVENVVLVMMHDLALIDGDVNKLKPLIDYCTQNDVPMVGITNSPEATIAEFTAKNQLTLPIYRNPTDMSKGPFIIRDAIPSNPGIILVSKGIVMKKWSYINTPKSL